MTVRHKHFLSLSMLLAAIVLQPVLAFAQAATPIDYSAIIDDDQLTAFESMSQLEIQHFLEAKQGYIRNFYMTLDTGEQVTAADLIYRASRNHKINPKFLLVLLQKEQGLIEDQSPVPNQLDWATGYGCLDNQPCNERWRGFHKQINSAAEQFRYYYEHIEEYTYRPGKATYVDGTLVIPKNRVTAALYNYTPHLSGNALFKALWEKYFSVPIPDGTLVQVKGELGVWLIQNGMKRAFQSRAALLSRHNPNLIVTVSMTDLDQFPRGADFDFSAYSIVKGTSPNIYLITPDQKRLITSMEVFRTLGFNPEELEFTSDDKLNLIPDGKPITLDDSYPTGTVLQDKVSSKLFYVESGRKYPLLVKEILSINYPTMKPVKVPPAALEEYATGLPVQFKEGALIKGSTTPEVYVISNHQKRHIASEKAFNQIGYKVLNIITTSDAVLDIHPTGDPIVEH